MTAEIQLESESLPRLGQLLIDRGLITLQELDRALDVQQRTGDRLGSVLMSLGLVRRRVLYEVLAELWQRPFVDLVRVPPAPDIVQRFDEKVLQEKRFVPIRLYRDGTGQRFLLLASSEQPTPDLDKIARHVCGDDIEISYSVTTDWDIDRVLADVFREELLTLATFGLLHRNPEESASRPFRRWQAGSVALLLALLVVGLVVASSPTVILISGVVNACFLASILFKFATSLAGLTAKTPGERVKAWHDQSADDLDLPTYTILVPVFREANIVAMLMDNLRGLDYPASKLEILLLIEESDEETLEAAKAAQPPETVTFIIVPRGQPQTKPRACNVGLFFARGEYLVIYDAEDRPEQDQLRKAVAAFAEGGPDLVCVQAALNYFNPSENWLTRMFTLEYSYWFDYMLPGLERLRLPIPLGGTSNHFRTDALRELGGWDPFNVTEDADLGIRASARGYRVGIINSTTFEEANNAVGNWIRQRSRWIKGYMQTALVHSRNPLQLVQNVGLKNAVGFSVLIGGSALTFLCTLPLWTLFIAWLVFGLPLDRLYPTPILYVGLFNLIFGNGLMVLVNILGVFKRRKYSLIVYALTNPFYWLLHSIASYKALWQLVFRPFYWEKTNHGISKQTLRTPGQPGLVELRHADESSPEPEVDKAA